MSFAPQLQDDHGLFPAQLRPGFRVREFLRCDRHTRPIVKALQSAQPLDDVGRFETDHQINIICKTEEAMGIDSQAFDDQVPDLLVI